VPQALLITVLAVVCATAGFLFYQWRAGDDSRTNPAATGQMLMAAHLIGLDGKAHPLEQWRGKVLVVNFWATWCAPCREEIPGFVKFQGQYGTHGVQIVGIAIDTAERVAPYIQEIGINYPILVGGIEMMDFARQIGNRAGVLPFTVVIDRHGEVVTTLVGIVRPEKLANVLGPLL
jgi:thiol-disulfide isomerase/thioredoxin